jgi:cytidine deaminase
VTDDGRIFAGGNVENASYGLSMCSERNAIFQMVSAGGAGRAIHALVVYTPTAQPTAPCGACRQVIQEFGPAARIVCVCGGPARLDFAQSDLLPGAFGPANLKS